MANIDSFKAAMVGGGARANQFRVDLAFPSFVTGGNIAAQMGQFMCKGASLPPSVVEKTEAHYRGRAVPLAGERTFEDWSVTIYNDTNNMIRNALEKWSNAINNNVDNTGITNPGVYMADLNVHQLGRNGETLKSYKIVDAWPTNVGNIELAYDSNNTIEEFTVTFAMLRWESNSTSGGGGIGLNVSVDTPLGTF